MGAEGGGDSSSAAKLPGDDQQQTEDLGLVAVNVRCSNGTKFSVKTNLESTVQTFKALVAQNCDVPACEQRLIYKGRILKDDQTLVSYGLQADHAVHMVRGFVPASSTPASAPAHVPSADSGVTRGVGSNEGGAFTGDGLGSPLFPGLGLDVLGGGAGGSPNMFGTELLESDPVLQQLSQYPNLMREIMGRSREMMDDPEFIRSLVMSDPRMREIIDRNPELGHVLNDPSILRQTLETARNPELMREMMRNTDRAMSNIEASPEGFNMLRRMYENVQEPYVSATTMGNNTLDFPNPNPFAARLANQARDASNNASATVPNTNPLPNPWSNNTASEFIIGSRHTNTAIRSFLAGDTNRAAGLAGLGGRGFPGTEQMVGNTPDAANMNQFLQNPAVPQISNPEHMNQMLGMQQALLSQLNRQQSTLESPNTRTTPGRPGMHNPASIGSLLDVFGSLSAGGLSTPNQPNVPPEEFYATELSQLQEMGFFDVQENIRALRATAGNVHAAVERLLGSHGP